jgi:transcription elongation factor SPT5
MVQWVVFSFLSANSGNFGPSFGGHTPFGVGRTPNPYANDGKTPVWNSLHIPNPYGDGGKMPAWNILSKTPNPHTDSRKI